MIRQKIVIIGLITTVLFVSCKSKVDQETPYHIAGIDPLSAVSSSETSKEVFLKWAEAGLKSKTLVCFDSTGGFRRITNDQIRVMQRLMQTNERKEHPFKGVSGIESSITRENYIRSAVRLGMFKEIYWILPYRLFDNIPLADRRVKDHLIGSDPGFTVDEINGMKLNIGCVSGKVNGIRLNICSYTTLPEIAEPVVLAIDANFIPVMASEYKVSKLRAFKKYFDVLKGKELRVLRADIIYGIEGGKTLPIHRYIGDQVIESLKKPDILLKGAPPELWSMRDMAENMLSGGEDRRVIEYLAEPMMRYRDDLPLRLLRATAMVHMKAYNDAFRVADDICKEDSRYCYSFIYLGWIMAREHAGSQAEKFFLRAAQVLPGMTISKELFRNN